MTIKPSERVLNLICRIALALFSLALVCSTAIPLIHTDQWWVRVFDFPRVQISVLIGLALAAYVALSFWRRMRIWEYALAALVVLSLIWQLIAIAPYTGLYRNEMSESRQENDSNRISLLVYNVRYDNREVKALLKLIRDNDPDLILLSEPTHWWFEKLKGLEDDYPHTIYQPQENHYGMLLFSKLELEKPEVRFLIEPEIPSFRTKVRLPSGTPITFYGVHPRPPGLDLPEEEENEGDDERADSDMRDAELMLVAKEIKELGETPVIVAGDFNDVAWSHTTHLFQRTGGLLDPRVGRGLMNTFDTRSRLLRYPLDHAFASEHFLLVELRRLPDIGSDHFPLFVVLDYDADASFENEEPQSDAEDEQEAEEAINKGKNSE